MKVVETKDITLFESCTQKIASLICRLNFSSLSMLMVVFSCIFGIGLSSVTFGFGVNNAISNDTLYFHPSHQQQKPSSKSDIELIGQLHTSAWHIAAENQTHFGFKSQNIFLQINKIPTISSSMLLIEDRHLNDIQVYATIEKNNTLTPTLLQPEIGIGFRSTRAFPLPKNTVQINIVATSPGPMIIPHRFIAQDEANVVSLSTTWSLGIFFGIAFIALLISSFHYSILKQTSLGLICFLIFNICIYTVSKSNLHLISDFPLHYLHHPGVQVYLLSLISISALYVQFFSEEHLVSREPSQTLSKLFRAAFLLIVTPILGYIFVEDTQFKINAFQILHLPSLVLGFIIAAIASSMSHKRNPEQGYLLLTWLFLGSSILIEGGEFLGVSYASLLPSQDLSSLPGILSTLSLIFLTFWSMNHSAIVQKTRTEAIQQLFDGVAEKNRALEINHARSSDLAQDIYRSIRVPTKNIVLLLNQDLPQQELQQEISEYLIPLEKSLQKLMLLGQDLQQSLNPQSVSFKLNSLLKRIPLAFQQRAVEHHVQIHLEVDASLPEFVQGDQSLLYKTALLIVEHRLQDLHNGVIRILVSRENDPRSPQVHLNIRIEDSGTPLEQEALEKLWGQTPALGSHDFQLILAKDMVFAMGGELKIDYDPTQGNCFHIRLIVERTYHHNTDGPANSGTGGAIALINSTLLDRQALLFQDFATAEPDLSTNLRSLGIKIHTAKNLQELATSVLIETPHFLFFEVDTLLRLDTIMSHLKKIQDVQELHIICLSSNETLEDEIESRLNMKFLKSPPNLDTLQQIIS